MPRELRAVAPKTLEIVDYEEEELAAGQVRVSTHFAAAKHGTEMAMLRGYAAERGRFNAELSIHEKPEGVRQFWGFTVGNMFVGEVTALGPEVEGLERGQRVLGYGGFRETQTVPASGLRVVPEEVSWQSAVCLDPADFAMAAVRDGQVRVGDAVAVFGMGAIGLLGIQIADCGGAHPVIAVEPLANRRAAAEACGADLTLNPRECDAGREIKLATDRRGADVVLEYSGARQALQHALRGVAYGGNVVAGAYPPPYGAGLDLGAEAHLNVPNIIFSRACSEPNRDHPRWDESRIYEVCWRMICEGRLRGDYVVNPVVPFEKALEAYLDIDRAPETNIKLGVSF